MNEKHMLNILRTEMRALAARLREQLDLHPCSCPPENKECPTNQTRRTLIMAEMKMAEVEAYMSLEHGGWLEWRELEGGAA